MPFDGKITMTRLQKLERLRELLDEATDEEQKDCGRCLMARMVGDATMQASGFRVKALRPGIVWATEPFESRALWQDQLRAARMFLGSDYSFNDSYGVFGNVSVTAKRKQIDELIAAERALVE